MKKSYHDENSQDVVVNLAKQLAGNDDANLTRIADEAEDAWQAELERDPELAARFDQDADRQFEKLMAKIHEKGIRPMTEEEFAQEKHLDNSVPAKKRKIIRFNKKILIGAAVAAVLAAGGSLVSVGRSGYQYSAYPSITRTNVERHNTQVEVVEDAMDEFYNMVQNQLGIPVLMMDYIPTDMYAEKVIAKADSIMMQFRIGKGSFRFKEAQLTDNNTTKIVLSDRKIVKTVHNQWLNCEIEVEKNTVATGKEEYSACVSTTEGYYYLEGNIDQDEFCEIISNLIYK